jgi:hypothetical protein
MWGVQLVGDYRHFVFRQNLLGKDGSVRRGVVMLKYPGLVSPKFGATSSQDFTQSPQKLRSRIRKSRFLPDGTGASRYHNCCVNGGIIPEYFGFHHVCTNTCHIS